MEHEFHLSEDADLGGAGTRIVAVIAVLLALCAVGAYVVYGSGLWQPQIQQHTGY